MSNHRSERVRIRIRLAMLAAMVVAGSFAEGCSCLDDGDTNPPPSSAGLISFSQGNYDVSAYSGALTITVSRTNGTVGAVSIQYSTSDGTATAADSDYTAIAPTTLNWADGDATPQTFQVLFPGSDDTVLEPNESFNLNLINPTGGVLVAGSSTVTLRETFTRFPGNPVMAANAGTWDTLDVEAPCVIKTGPTSYVMFYEGGDPTTDYIGRATSTDGVMWTRAAAPILSPGGVGAFDEAALWRPWALLNGTTWHLWYTGVAASGAGSIGYATTTDVTGATGWTKFGGGAAPVLAPVAGTFDEVAAAWACVILDAGTFKMWYSAFTATTAAIAYTTSPNGSTWTNPRTLVVFNGPIAPFETGGAFQPGVIKDGSVYRMWYTGDNGTAWQIGYARSTDGTTWTRYGGNPVLPVGSSSWDNAETYYPGPMRDGDIFKLWYTGDTNPADPATYQIGLATNP